MQFHDHLNDLLSKESLAYDDNIIINGDFNCTINPLLEKTRSMVGFQEQGKKLLNALKKYSGNTESI